MTKKNIENFSIKKSVRKLSMKPSTNIKGNRKRSQFIYTVIVVTIPMNLIEVVTPPAISHSFSTRKMF